MRIGVDYYPEQWDRSMWERDAELMARTGVKLVRIGGPAWLGIEPREGEYNFSWLDEVISIFSRYAIGIVICMPTGCPPLWLYEKYPEIGGDDRRINDRTRGHICINSPVFREYARKINEKLARHFSGNTAIAAWQIDNVPEPYQCCCDTCRGKFREWLLERYETVEGINKAFGNSIYSGGYSSITQIQPPVDYPEERQNPALCLDWYRFICDCMADFVRDSMMTIRMENPKVPVTASMQFCENIPDFYKICNSLGFVSCDDYPPMKIPSDREEYYSHAFHADFVRGIKNRKFWITEHISRTSGSQSYISPAPEQGMIMGYALQAIVHGADTVFYSRWRTALTGADMYSHGIFDHSNIPNRRFAEFSELCRRIYQLKVLDDTYISSDAAIIYSSEADAAFRIQPQSEGFSYIKQLQAFHSALTHFGANVDVIPPDADLSGYKLVIVPSLYVNRKSVTENIYRYVINGGTLVMTTRSGVKDGNNNCIIDILPTVFKELIGAEITEFNPTGLSEQSIRDFAGNEFICRYWCDILRLTSARAYAEYSSDVFSCMPAVTMNRYCGGVAYYVGTVCSRAFYESFVSNLMMQTGIPKLKGLPEGIEVTTRKNSRDEYICFFNNSGKSVSIPLPKPMYSIINSTGRDRLELRPFEMDIVRK
ncbi:MAG: beta-galactosidase [Ruminococcus sp.]|nr:beta-galactosidase [Ruminococcus sp.]MDE6784490.1 beta-galactosidase [Ruminococcus sp.]